MRTAIALVVFLMCSSVAFAEVTLKMKDGVVLTWKDYFEEGNSYCTWKSMGKFCVPQSDVKVIKETVGNGQYDSPGSSSGGYSSSSGGSSRSESSGRSSTIIQKKGSGVIIDEGLSKEERDAEKQKLEYEEGLRRYEREKRLEKEREDAKFREEQRRKEEEERRYKYEREQRIKREENNLYKDMRNR